MKRSNRQIKDWQMAFYLPNLLIILTPTHTVVELHNTVYAGTYRDPYWPSGGGCTEQEYAPLLYVWPHREQGQSHVHTWCIWQNSCFSWDPQVRHYTITVLLSHVCYHDSVLIKSTPDFCQYQFECRGEIPIKGLGNLKTYFVESCQEFETMYCTKDIVKFT